MPDLWIFTATVEEISETIKLTKSAKSRARGNDGKYKQIIEEIFLSHYTDSAHEVAFERAEIRTVAGKFGVRVPENLGDVVYNFRFRNSMPAKVQEKAGPGNVWIIRLAGSGRYRSMEVPESLAFIYPTRGMAETKVPDSTPGVIVKYALSDEQALLAKSRYNRLIDVFTGVACYSLQNHLRTRVTDMGQVETDEVYVGVDRKGVHYVFPVQAKGGTDSLSIVQVEQDWALCHEKFPSLVCRPIAAQFMKDSEGRELIVLLEFEVGSGKITRGTEKQYRLVPPDGVDAGDLATYRSRIE